MDENRVMERRGLLAALVVLFWLLPRGDAAAQDKLVLKGVAQSPTTEVSVHLAASQQSRSLLELTVQTRPPLQQAPSIVLLGGARGAPRPLKVARDDKTGAWMGTLEVEQFGAGAVRVDLPGGNKSIEQHVTEFALRGVAKEKGSELYSANGRFSMLIPPGRASDQTRFLVTSLERPPAPLPQGVTLEGGPYEVSPAGGEIGQVKAVVVIVLSRAVQKNEKGAGDAYQILWLNPEGGAWERLESAVDPTGRSLQAPTSHLGTFVLTSVRK